MFCSSEANNRSSYLFHKLTSFSMRLKFTFIVWHFLLFYLTPAWIHVKIPNPWGNKQESVSQSHGSQNKHRCLPRPQAVRNPTTQIGVYFCWLLKWRGIEAHDLLLFIFVRLILTILTNPPACSSENKLSGSHQSLAVRYGLKKGLRADNIFWKQSDEKRDNWMVHISLVVLLTSKKSAILLYFNIQYSQTRTQSI